MYSRLSVGKCLADMSSIKNSLKQGDAILSLLFNVTLHYAIRRVQANQERLNLNSIHQFLVYGDDVNAMGRKIHTIQKNTKALLVTCKESGLHINTERAKYMVMSQGQDAGQNYNLNKSFEKVEHLKCLRTTLTNQNSIHKEIKSRLQSLNACCHSLQNLPSSSLLSHNKKIKVYKTIILPVVLYECKTWSLTLREKHRLKLTENGVRLHNELNDLYSKQ